MSVLCEKVKSEACGEIKRFSFISVALLIATITATAICLFVFCLIFDDSNPLNTPILLFLFVPLATIFSPIITWKSVLIGAAICYLLDKMKIKPSVYWVYLGAVTGLITTLAWYADFFETDIFPIMMLGAGTGAITGYLTRKFIYK